MAYLMGKHGEDFVGLHAFEERIEEDDPFRFAQAGKIGVGVPAPRRLVHLEHFAQVDARSRCKGDDGFLERPVLHRRELIEEGFDHVWRYIGDKNGEQEEEAPHPEPPEPGARLHKRQPAERRCRQKREG